MSISLVVSFIYCLFFFSVQSSYGEERLSPPVRLKLDLPLLDISFNDADGRYVFSMNQSVALSESSNQVLLVFEKNEFSLGINLEETKPIPPTIKFGMNFLAQSLVVRPH